MAIEQRDVEMIDAYLRGELDESGQAILQKRKSDPQFAILLEEMIDANKTIRAEGRVQMKNQLRKWDKTEKVKRLVRKRTVIGVAASILILVVAYFAFRPSQDLTAVAEKYLEPYPNIVAPIQKGGEEDMTPYARAFQLYEMGYYDKAEDQFNILDQDDASVQFYLAVTALLDDEIHLGRTRLEEIVEDPGHRYHAPAQWYAALACLKEDDKGDAVILLEQVAEGNSPVSERARRLLDDIL